MQGNGFPTLRDNLILLRYDTHIGKRENWSIIFIVAEMNSNNNFQAIVAVPGSMAARVAVLHHCDVRSDKLKNANN